MNPNKEQVQQYFSTDRTFIGGKTLYLKLVNTRRSFINRLNHMPETLGNLSKLHYELACVAGYTDRGLTILLQQPLQKIDNKQDIITSKTTQPGDTSPPEVTDQFTLPVFEKGLPGMKAKKAFAQQNKIIVVGTGKSGRIKGVDLDTAFRKWQIDARLKKQSSLIAVAPKPVKQALKLRQQFPFLALENCPKVYKELTADLITAYDKYVAGHQNLFKTLTEEELQQAVADVVVPYKENKLIWAELKHYQTKGEPLGKHPIFEEIHYKKSLADKSGDELATEKANLKSSISKSKKPIKAAKNKTEKKVAQEKQDKLKSKLAFVIAELESR